MIDLRKLEQFVCVAEESHFNKAAERLNMSQPPLTHAIRKLEEDLGVTLIERKNRVFGLTPAGEIFLHEAREILKHMEYAISVTRDTAAGRSGLLKLGYVGSALYGKLPNVIRAFKAESPNVRLELREATSAGQIKALREGSLDIGIVIPPLHNAEDIQTKPFDTDRLAMALPKTHPLAAKTKLKVSDLADEPFILWPMVEGRSFHLQAIKLCTDAGFVPNIAQEAYSMHAVLSLVAIGLGVSIVPGSMSSFRNEEIIYKKIQSKEANFNLHMATRGKTPLIDTFLKSL